MKNLNSRLILSLSLGFSLLTSACTHIRPQPVKPLDAQALAGAKTSASVALVLDAPFTNYTYSYDMSGDKFEFPLGSALVQSATNAAQAACQQVAVCASRQEAAGKADAILIPKVTRVNTKKSAGYAKRQFLICVEWSLLDRDAGKLLWLDTIAGRGEYEAAMTKSREQKMIQLGFDDLTLKTVQSLRGSPAMAKLGMK